MTQTIGPDEALRRAARDGDVQAIEAALAAGADPNSAGPSGDRAVHAAAGAGMAKALALLIEAQADPNPKGCSGDSPLHRAAEICHAECVGMLIKAGADPNAADSDGRTPLMIRTANPISHPDGPTVVRELALAGWPGTATLRDPSGRTAADMAERPGDAETIRAICLALDESEALEKMAAGRPARERGRL